MDWYLKSFLAGKYKEDHMLKFENVSKVYDDGFKAVDSVNFEIQKENF